MKLSYRGVNYDFKPSSLQYRGAKQRMAEVAKARALGAILTYRGSAYAVQPASQDTTTHAGVASGRVLTYRGVSYTVQPTALELVSQPTAANATAPVAKAPARSIEEQARVLTMNHHRAMRNRQQVMLVRSATEVGMPATALNHWERIQGFNSALQATYDRSHVALS